MATQLSGQSKKIEKPLIRSLVVEDEARIRLFLTKTLQRMRHQVEAVASGEAALDTLNQTEFDVLLLDLRLGGSVDGQRILEAVRWRWPATIVIILTAHGTFESAMDAIQEGVDGYLLKPVRPADIRRAVTDALNRREKLIEAEQAHEQTSQITLGALHVDLDRIEVYYDDRLLELSPREFSLLVYLMEQAPQVVEPKKLVGVVREYQPEYEHEAREIIKWYIHRLRQKIEPDPSNPRHILNVRGVGYRFAA